MAAMPCSPPRPPTCPVALNLFGSHSPPLAAYLARVSEPDVSLTRHTRMAHRLFSEYPAPWGGVLYRLWSPKGLYGPCSASGWMSGERRSLFGETTGRLERI